MLTTDFTVRSIRVSECMLNAAEDLVSHQPGDINPKERGIIRFSPSYSVRIEENEVMLFSSITRFIVWISRSAYEFLKEHENEMENSLICSIPETEDAERVKAFFDELNRYGILSAA